MKTDLVPDVKEAFMALVIDLSIIANDVPEVRKHQLFLKWFDGLPKLALYEKVLKVNENDQS